jgi:hypothetical protein
MNTWRPITTIRIALLVLVPFLRLAAQAPTFGWAHATGDDYTDLGRSVATDAQGNVHATGYFKDTVDFDPGPGVFNLIVPASQSACHVQKLDPAGNLIWARKIGGGSTTWAVGESITVDAWGNVLVTGHFYGTGPQDFDPGPGVHTMSTTGGSDVFVVKLRPSGSFVWAKQMGGTLTDGAYAIATDAQGSVHTTGSFMGTGDYDPGAGVANLSANGTYHDLFVSKLDSNGNFVWAKSCGGANGVDVGLGITIDSSQHVCVTGYFEGTADFDMGPGAANHTSAGLRDIFVLKMDPAGAYVWAKTHGGPGDDYSREIKADATGALYVGGSFEGTISFNTTTLSALGNEDCVLFKLTPGGMVDWAKGFGSVEMDKILDLALDAGSNVYSTGYFGMTADFDPGPGVAWIMPGSQHDGFVSKMDRNGNYVWAGNVGTPVWDYCHGIGVSRFNDVYVTGLFQGTGDFDPTAGVYNLSSHAGSQDAFLFKLNGCIPSRTAVTANSCGPYTLNSVTYTETGTYLQVLASSTGCDSVITLHLTTATAAPAQPQTIAGDTLLCAGSVNGYSVSPVPDAASYTWMLPPGWTGSSNTPALTATASASGGVLSVTADNACGSSPPQSMTIHCIPNPPAPPSFLTGPDSLCANSAATYAVNTVPTASTYTWTLPPGWTGSSNSNSIGVTAGPTGGGLSITANNVCGASAPFTPVVTVIAPPAQPGPIAGDDSICAGSVNGYSIAPVPGAVSYSWSLPAGWTGGSTSNSITATANAVGGNVGVHAENGCGNSTVQTLGVSVTVAPTAAFSFSANLLSVQFTDQSLGATAWWWDLGDGNVSTLQHPAHVYALPGSYTACLVASAGGCADTLCQTVAVIGVGMEDGPGGNVSVFPNPSAGRFQVETGREMDAEVWDLQGRVILRKRMGAGMNVVDLGGEADGMYLLRVVDGEEEYRAVLVKRE